MLGGAAMLMPGPARGAQTAGAPQTQVAPQPDAQSSAPTDQPAADTALDAMPDIGLDWPDLDAPAPKLPAPSTQPDHQEAGAPPTEAQTNEGPGERASEQRSTPAASVQAGEAGNAVPAAPNAQIPSALGQAQDGQPASQQSRRDRASLRAARQASEQTAEQLAQIDPTARLRYSVVFEGLGDADADTLMQRFDAFSELRKGGDARANLAQIRRRGRTDADLLDQLLRVRGYYDADTQFDLRPNGGGDTPHIEAVLRARPGQRYKVTSLTLAGLPDKDAQAQNLRALFNFAKGDPADTDQINAAVEHLRTGLGQRGYPFAKIASPVLTVDHDNHDALLNLVVDTGHFRRFGAFKVAPGGPFDARHVATISRLTPGEPFDETKVEDLNRALIATGLISRVEITPERAADDQNVDLDIKMISAPPRTVAGELGYGTGEGFRAEASWQHRNLFPPEGGLTLRGVAGTQEQSLSAAFRRNNFHRRDRALNLQVNIDNADQPAYQALTAGVSASIERQTNLIFQKKWTWSLGSELAVSSERDIYDNSTISVRRVYVIAALPTSLNYDGSDDLLNPSRGFRLGLRVSPELSLQGSIFGYLRTQFDASSYIHVSDRLVIAERVRLGTIIGATRDRVAPTRRFYAGGGASVRGYSYQAIGPRDANNNPLGGVSLGEFSLEARYRFGSTDQFGLVPFIDAGTVGQNPLPPLQEMRVGVGIGVRYYTNFGPIRVDVGTPLNPQPGDARIGVYVGLGQAF